MKICPNCSADLFPVYKLDYDILTCNSCHLQIADNAVFKSGTDFLLDEEAREKALKRVRLINFSKIIKVILSYFNKKQINGLEVGCGHGWFLDLCHQYNINCAGIEPDTRFNALYKEKGYSVLNGFYPDVLDSNTKYDFVVFNDVLEHIPDISRVMAANSQHLVQSGLLIVNIPVQQGFFYSGSLFLYHLGIKIFLNRMWQFNFKSPHLYYFTKRNLIGIAQKSGFELVKMMPLQVLDPSQIKNRLKQDPSIGIIKLGFLTLITFLLLPFTRIYPDIICFFFRKTPS